MRDQEKGQGVIHRSKHDKKPRDISHEPEMKRLKELLDAGEVEGERLWEHLEEELTREDQETDE